ncbi:MAG: universal stress protein [Chloroflexi bacterium RBG_13_56_8b]|nr:MAG: universal stress protein [Chloroflexi bacterium RBG_13_56_8b]
MEFNKILVPVTGSTADDEVIKLACQLGKKNKAKIWAIYVLTVKRSLPLDAEVELDVKKAESVLDHVANVAENEGYEVETDLLQSREAGPTIVDEAVEREAELILMGVIYKRRFGQFSLGSVVPYVLQNAPCQVILYHQYTP